MEQQPPQTPLTEIVSFFNKEQPLNLLKNDLQHLEQTIDNKINEKILVLEKTVTEKVVQSPITKQLVKDAIEEELKEAKDAIKKELKEELQKPNETLKKELLDRLTKLEERCAQDIKPINQNFISLSFGVTLALIFYLWHYTH